MDGLVKLVKINVRPCVRLSVLAVSTFAKPQGSEIAGPRSMKLGVYILCVGGQNF